jgi:hypothetical protein
MKKSGIQKVQSLFDFIFCLSCYRNSGVLPLRFISGFHKRVDLRSGLMASSESDRCEGESKSNNKTFLREDNNRIYCHNWKEG